MLKLKYRPWCPVRVYVFLVTNWCYNFTQFIFISAKLPDIVGDVFFKVIKNISKGPNDHQRSLQSLTISGISAETKTDWVKFWHQFATRKT